MLHVYRFLASTSDLYLLQKHCRGPILLEDFARCQILFYVNWPVVVRRDTSWSVLNVWKPDVIAEEIWRTLQVPHRINRLFLCSTRAELMEN